MYDYSMSQGISLLNTAPGGSYIIHNSGRRQNKSIINDYTIYNQTNNEISNILFSNSANKNYILFTNSGKIQINSSHYNNHHEIANNNITKSRRNLFKIKARTPLLHTRNKRIKNSRYNHIVLNGAKNIQNWNQPINKPSNNRIFNGAEHVANW